MKIVGITGDSGSGKSTLAKYLYTRLKCEMIDVDKIILKSDLLKDFEKTNHLKMEDEGCELLTDTFKNENSLIISTINEIIERECKSISPDNDLLIVEWRLLPYLKIWKQCDNRILIESKKQECKENEIDNKLISEAKYDNCFSNVKIDYSQFEYDYVIRNNFDKE